MKTLTTLFVLLFSAAWLAAQSPVGEWKTIDDETGKPKSHLQLYESNGKLYGKVVKMLISSPDKLCDKCPDERKNQPIMGMVVLIDMEKKGGYWKNGHILDPDNGKWYTCSFWLKDGDPNVLVVRGYIGPFFRTQNWYRVQ